MNQTAKKLREAADYMKCEGVASVVGDIRAEFEAIADELDELQARAAEAGDLRQRLESAEGKAERRKRHIGYLNTALHDKNVLFKQRGEALAKVTKENAELRKQVPSERERQILDMWPRFEDGDPVMPGDKVHYASTHNVETEIEVESITVMDGLFVLCDDECRSNQYEQGQRVKRPAQSVLDADGVEIHVGDTVWHCNGIASGVVTSIDAGSLMNTTRYVDESGTEFRDAARNLTHIAPDSWERLEEDVNAIVTGDGLYHRLNNYCNARDLGGDDVMCLTIGDIVRRAKALAGVEAE